MAERVNLPPYNSTDFTYPVGETQWRHCLWHIAYIQYQHKTFLPILKEVYTLEIPEATWKGNYHSLADFRMKLRRVFYWWAHRTQGYVASPTSAVSSIPATSTDFGWADRWYCFCSAVRRTFFEHNRRGNTGKRRQPMVKGFPQSMLDLLRGSDSTRRDHWFGEWNKIHSRRKQFRDKSRAIVPPLAVEEAAKAITQIVYFRIQRLGDMLYLLKTQEDSSVSWMQTMVDRIMLEHPVVLFELWLQQESSTLVTTTDTTTDTTTQ